MRRRVPESPRTRPTTFRRSVTAAAGLLLVPGAAWAADEAELVQRYLDGPVARAGIAAVDARAAAAGAAPGLLANPALEAGREVEGDGATVDLLGGSLTVDLGMSGVPAARAAALHREAAPHLRAAAVLDEVCGLRTELRDLVARRGEVEVREQALARLTELSDTARAEARVGEGSTYAADRVALARVVQAEAVALALAEEEALHASLERRIGGPLDGVALADAGPLPSRDAAVEGARTAHPALAALRVQRDAATRAETAARRSGLPDLTLSGAARWDTPAGDTTAGRGLEVGGALELPIFDRRRPEIRATTAHRAEQEAALLRAEAAAEARAAAAWAQARAAEDFLADAGASLSPTATWAAARARWEAGEADLDELLQVSAAVQDAELSLVRARHRAGAAHLSLSCAVGRFPDPAIQAAVLRASGAAAPSSEVAP